MAQTGTTVIAYISEAVKVNKALIRVLRNANRELRTIESQTGTGHMLTVGGIAGINRMMFSNKAPVDR